MIRDLARKAIPFAFVGALAFASAGCTVVLHGPPPHPEPGYVYRTADGVELVYRAGIDLYIVSGMPDVYYYRGRFFRRERNHWFVTRHLHRGRWDRADRRDVPPRFRKRPFKEEHRATRRDRGRRRH